MHDLNEQDRTFREEVRAFIDAEFPADLREKADLGRGFSREEQVGWHKKLAERGWL